jgi:hypothetical protein
MGVRSTLGYANLLGSTEDPDWKIYRYPFTPGGGVTLATLFAGAVVYFDATRANLLPGLAANDAQLDGIVIDLPDQSSEGFTVANATFADGVYTAGSLNQLTSASAAFTSSDVGKVVTAGGTVTLPPNTVILSVQSATQVTLSNAASAAGTAQSFTIVGRTVTVTPTDQTIGVAINGTFDFNQIKYADGSATISAAGQERLAVMGIVLDKAVISGPFSP